MLFFLLLFSILLVEIRSQSLQTRALNVANCTNQKSYEYIVSIQRNEKHTCNGVIIGDHALLTTALCCTQKLQCSKTGPCPQVKVLQVLNLDQPTDTFPKDERCRYFNVLKCIPHPQYEKGKYYIEYDTAILVVDGTFTEKHAPLVDAKPIVKDYSEICQKGMIVGRWLDQGVVKPPALLQCFPVTIRHLQRCAEVSTHVYLKKSRNHTLTCSFDASNRREVCNAFYGAPVVCNGVVVAIVSHKFNFSEQCEEVSPFYHSRIDWSLDFRIDYLKGKYAGRSSFEEDLMSRKVSNGSEPIYIIPYFLIFLSAICGVLML